MASIGKVPASPWPEVPPPAPQAPESLLEKFARENGITLAQAMDRINGDASFNRTLQALSAQLRRSERDNFLEIRIVRDPAVTAEVAFVHDPQQTLARYTTDSRFKAVRAPRNRAELERLHDVWTKRLQQSGVTWGMGIDAFDGQLQIDMGISEPEFHAIADAQGWTWGDEVRFSFAPPAPAAQTDAAARYPFHLFPRSKAGATLVATVAINGTVVLDHGCFRLLDGKGKPADLVLFDRNAHIGQDRDGYLAVFRDGKVASRIGEPAIWGGYPGANESDPDVLALRQACGAGRISSVGIPASARLFSLPDAGWVANFARAKRLEYLDAWRQVIGCMRRYEDERGAPRFLEARDACIRQFN